ncbi:MAG: YceD family protein [Bosea sp. (in: a-proteobacteria)]
MTQPSGSKTPAPPKMSAPPLSRIVGIETIRPSGLFVKVDATPDECVAIASSFRLPSVEQLHAEFRLERKGDRVTVTGTVAANLHQTCIVSLEAFTVTFKEDVTLAFLPEEDVTALIAKMEAEEGDLDELEGRDPDRIPDPIIDNAIDLGAVACEFLSLGLDPYPRKPGAVFENESAKVGSISPFSALAGLKDRN